MLTLPATKLFWHPAGAERSEGWTGSCSQLVGCMALFILAKFKQQSTTVNSRASRAVQSGAERSRVESLVLGQPSISIPLCAKLLFYAHCLLLLSFSSCHSASWPAPSASAFSCFLAIWTWLLSLCVCWCPRWYLTLRLFPLKQCGHGIGLWVGLGQLMHWKKY